MCIYRRLRDLREDADLTQKQAGELLNTTQQQYAKYELGVQEIPARHLITLAEHYNVSLDYITGRVDWDDVQIYRILKTWKPEQKLRLLKSLERQ